ncbi:MAG: low molecular weight phosphotyrosine protein phosphatase [Proteobacteria bacterium]|nr:low molecular weight phosphotyrosine protein phosphatase [Pseudomonadota bacterium]
MVAICFVCLGNICRSPTAEGIMAHLVRGASLEGRIHVDSAGTSAYHVGESADRRSRQIARERGVELTSTARQFVRSDFSGFEYVVAMDRSNLKQLQRLARARAEADKLHLLRSFDPASSDDMDVPDPYYGGAGGFDRVFDICLAGCRGLLDHIVRVHIATGNERA